MRSQYYNHLERHLNPGTKNDVILSQACINLLAFSDLGVALLVEPFYFGLLKWLSEIILLMLRAPRFI